MSNIERLGEYGKTGGPGRGKGSLSGRAKCLATLDSILHDEKNQETLKAAMEKLFNDSPVKFYMTFVVPLLPKEMIVKAMAGTAEDAADNAIDITARIQTRVTEYRRLMEESTGEVGRDDKGESVHPPQADGETGGVPEP